MGEHATRRRPDGTVEYVAKLGTMDDWRNVRRAEAEAWAVQDAGAGTNVPLALRDPSILWRFPWPGEDGQTVALDVNGRDMFRTATFRAPAELLPEEHSQIVHSLSPQGMRGAYSVNCWHDCPQDPRTDMRNTGHLHEPGVLVQIHGERYAEGSPRTIFRCACCGAPFSLDQDELDEMRGALLGMAKMYSKSSPTEAAFRRELAERITAREPVKAPPS